jgi:hypothetical protein
VAIVLMVSCVPSQVQIEEMLDQTRIAEPTPTSIQLSSQSTIPSSTSSSEITLGKWYDTWSFAHSITITKKGGEYKMKEVYPDGSERTITLFSNVVAGETHLYDTLNAYGDYMVIKSDGRLAFYDNQGFIYDIQPSSSSSPSSSPSSSSSSSSNSSSSSSSSECDAWWDSLETAYILSGGEDTQLTDYIMGEMAKASCPPR